MTAAATKSLFEAWADGWDALATGMTDWFSQPPMPLDLVGFSRELTARRKPSWSSPHTVVFETPVARLRDFSTARSATVVPTLVLPPQAGHDSCIVDYSPQQSQMRAILDAGLERALSLDWVGATPQSADAGIEDYLEAVERAINHCGGRVNLIGDCQGGWLAAIYAALYPDRINTLTLAGAPIDFHAGEPVIHEVLRLLAPNGDLRFYEALVAASGGVLKGEHMLGGFIMIEPAAEISKQTQLLLNLHDERQVARYREFEDWYKHTQDIPGQFYLWIVRNLFRDNALISGELQVRGRRVELSKIDMPLNLMAGAKDHITPPDQVFALADLVSTPRELVEKKLSTGGHLGLFMSREALREQWPLLLEHVRRHSVL